MAEPMDERDVAQPSAGPPAGKDDGHPDGSPPTPGGPGGPAPEGTPAAGASSPEPAASPQPEPGVPPAAPPAPPPATPSPAAPPAPAPPSWLERIPGYAAPLLLVAVPLLVALAAQVWPEAVYDQFVWKYYWGPIKADAEGGGCQTWHGVQACAGYNLVNTASWAVLLGLCIVGTGQLLQRFKAKMDGRLIVAATLWVVAGSLFHVLEDAKLFAIPLRYFFITPIIYLIFAALGVACFVIGQYLRTVAERATVALALQKLWMILAVPVLGYLFLDLQGWGQVNHYLSPVAVAASALVAFAACAWRFRRLGRVEPSELVACLSLGWILVGAAYLLLFEADPWPSYLRTPDPLRPALLAPLLALGVVAAVRIVARLQARAHPVGAAAFLNPINGLLLFSQMLDAFATAMGIDIGHYSEKHVLSARVIDATRDLGAAAGLGPVEQYPTFFGFLPVKFLVSVLVVYAIDVSNPKESQRHPTLIGLVKFAVIMVGIGPGIRDFVRMALGI